ncbi:30S ribosomal protein S1 [Tuwongella immobilis]|uniref:S1 motif domain-containing protein n=1 Tax=Tuwongella immobilis TaxID=692036 RepID=A0A6C2YKV7_9BACT|nr:S1 RNA-binding domain-containing protein [Tuwongella immobilis]VIP02007.1 30s ribosomal protein s1 : Ribosomal protein S1 OS=Singulisphaera acidiphila (strain ATCC BAA-1392 / DSM 18658 / VKM B-2454 / MOB10) GN=Sinac_5356 PE=4 SV=1: S1: S1: S1 [Tuwongella immobilis]VTS00108.1 30s ribosomal protein s1 : Ribosomal protein S1 OS=Singulisphaera acidiphila (strain ATCC BAA-1392 / DSM 18658 / VKM B-2454 / MOB10) GN=Sinac_5356 PE=4 SV=1: S1: S1: S1 [Tuwongella immobilis]
MSSDEPTSNPKPTPPPAMEHRPAPRPNRPGGPPRGPSHPRPGMRPDGSVGAPQRSAQGAPAGRNPAAGAKPGEIGGDDPLFGDAPVTPENFDASQVRFRREKPATEGGKPPALDQQQLPTSQLRLRDLDQAIEAELEAALAGVSSDSLFAEPADGKNTRKDAATNKVDRTRGRVVSVHQGDIFIEVPGSRSQGVMSVMQFDVAPKVGDIVEFDVERFDSANGLLILTRKGAAAVDVDWSSVSIGTIVEARVTAVNKGGLSVEVNGLRGFLPISQIDMYRVENAEMYVNERLKCMVTEVSPEDRNLVVSRRALLEKERENLRETFWAQVQVGQIREGIVRSVKPFGAFVDLGGADGMIPAGELSWGKVNDPSDVVSIGQKVQVKIVRIDLDGRKIGLSLRALVASPWDSLRDRVRPGLQITGTVTRLMDFGAFVEVEPGIEGLIHIGELGRQRVRRVNDVVKIGQEVTVQVLNVDLDARRISLSLKAVEEAKAKAEESANAASRPQPEPEPEVPVKPRVKPANLKGGTGSSGPLFPNLPSSNS